MTSPFRSYLNLKNKQIYIYIAMVHEEKPSHIGSSNHKEKAGKELKTSRGKRRHGVRKMRQRLQELQEKKLGMEQN